MSTFGAELRHACFHFFLPRGYVDVLLFTFLGWALGSTDSLCDIVGPRLSTHRVGREGGAVDHRLACLRLECVHTFALPSTVPTFGGQFGMAFVMRVVPHPEKTYDVSFVHFSYSIAPRPKVTSSSGQVVDMTFVHFSLLELLSARRQVQRRKVDKSHVIADLWTSCTCPLYPLHLDIDFVNSQLLSSVCRPPPRTDA